MATQKKQPSNKSAGLEGLRGLVATNAGPPRNPELEAAIASDPDDPAGVLVYGDWLEAQGDPRGKLIALQQRAAESGTKKDEKAASAFLKEHEHALHGLSGGHGKKVALEWGIGFFRSATISFATPKKAIAALEELLAHPSACFLRELVVRPPKARDDIDFDAIASVLVANAPVTLRHLLVGRPGQWRIPEALYDALPRLRQDDGASWTEACSRVRGQRKLKVNLDAAKLPPLQPRNRAVELDPEDLESGLVVMGMRMELDKGRALGLIESMRQVFTGESLDSFANAMMEQWVAGGERSQDRWIYDAVGAIGGDQCVASIGARLADMSHQRATVGMKHLANIATDAAITEIVGVSITPSRFAPRREAADELLASVAKSRAISVSQLLVRSAPRSVPAASQKRVVDIEKRWLFELMVHGERIDGEDFVLHVGHHRYRADLAAGLLWASFDGEKVTRLFALDPQNSHAPTDDAGELFSIEGGAKVGVVHRLELDDKDRLRWAKRLPPSSQPFPQLDRASVELTDAERASDTLTRYARRRVGFHRIREGLEEADWFPYTDHGIEGFGRRFRRGRQVTIVAHIGLENTGSIGEVWAQPSSERWMSTKHLPLDKIHPVVLSEALLNIERTVGRQAPAAAPAATRPKASAGGGTPQRGRYPFAELAKSSRSKCVICGDKIEKQTVRVGIEREFETPNFTGKATAWLHPACTSDCPELAGLSDLDARLTANSNGVWPPADGPAEG